MRRQWRVIAVSSNRGSFGHVSRIIGTASGECYQCLRVDCAWNERVDGKRFNRGDVFDCTSALEPYLLARGFEIVTRLPDMPASVVREVFDA